MRITLFRAAHELLFNVLKHAGATTVKLTLTYNAECVCLRVEDDGRGFDLAQMARDRLGLGIMQERAQAIGAALTVESQPRHGTRVNVLWKQERKQETP